MQEQRITPNMKLVITRDYLSLSTAAAAMIIEVLTGKPEMTLMAATGETPTGAYRKLAESAAEQGMIPVRFRLIALDEWAGLPGDDPATCRTYLQTHLVSPLGIPESRCSWFLGEAPAPDAACKPITAALSAYGPPDLAVLGIGKNGHIGLNEPGDFLKPGIHAAVLEETTRSHTMLSRSSRQVTSGYTLGMAEVLQTERILLLASGAEKGPALARLFSGLLSTWSPATLLHLHPDVTCICDQAAYDAAVQASEETRASLSESEAAEPAGGRCERQRAQQRGIRDQKGEEAIDP